MLLALSSCPLGKECGVVVGSNLTRDELWSSRRKRYRGSYYVRSITTLAITSSPTPYKFYNPRLAKNDAFVHPHGYHNISSLFPHPSSLIQTDKASLIPHLPINLPQIKPFHLALPHLTDHPSRHPTNHTEARNYHVWRDYCSYY